MSGSAILDARGAPEARTRDVIDSPHHPAAARVADVLRSRSSRPRTLVIDDEENIAQAIRAKVTIIAVCTSVSELDDALGLQKKAPSADVHVFTDEVMSSLFGHERRSRVFALAHAPRPASWRDIADAPGDLVVLDAVKIAGNIGAIIRSSCAFGAAGVVLVDSGITSIYDRRLIRASRGLLFSIPVLLATASEVETFLRAERMLLASMTADATSPLTAIAATAERVAILMGSERRGASDALTAIAGQRYAVPMAPGVESLNVSVAAAIALYERRRART